MPTIFIFMGLRFVFFSNDHEPIHVHVIKGKGKIKQYAKFSIEPDVTLLENNGLDHKDIQIAKKVIIENKELIATKWNDFFNKNRKGEAYEN